MAIKERNQDPVIGDTINLRFISWNGNNFANVSEITKVETYFLDPVGEACATSCDKTLKETFLAASITNGSVGNYLLPLPVASPTYVIGQYQDEWHIIFAENDPVSIITQRFQIFPNLWFTASIPAVYSFDFRFQPNRIRQGSRKHLIIQIIPNVPRATDLERYYTNLAISSDIKISIEQNCGPCAPAEQDLRLIVDKELVTIRDKVFAFYQLDTADLDCGIYHVWFEIEFLGNIDVSPKMQFQIF